MRINRAFRLTLATFVFATMGFAINAAHAEPVREALEDYENAVDDAIDLTAEEYEHGSDAAHGGAHHEEIDGLPQLDFTTYTSQIFWMFAGFILLYILFAKKSIPEISGSVETRREKIEGDLDNAHEFKDQAAKVHAEYEAALQEARAKASATFKATEDAIKANSNSRLEAFKERANTLTQDTEASLTKAKQAAMQDTQAVAAEIASMAAEKIVGISTDIKQAETLVKNIGRKAA